jgi:hypothetical protein
MIGKDVGMSARKISEKIFSEEKLTNIVAGPPYSIHSYLIIKNNKLYKLSLLILSLNKEI